MFESQRGFRVRFPDILIDNGFDVVVSTVVVLLRHGFCRGFILRSSVVVIDGDSFVIYETVRNTIKPST